MEQDVRKSIEAFVRKVRTIKSGAKAAKYSKNLMNFDPGKSCPDFLKVTIDIETGHIIFYSVENNEVGLCGYNPFSSPPEFSFKDLKGEELHNIKLSQLGEFNEAARMDFAKMFATLVGSLNGFCRVISELSPKNQSTKEVSEKLVDTKERFDEFGWNIVPIRNIEYLSSDGGQERVKFTISTGVEMPYHKRRGHWRTIIKKDGTVDRKWIEEMEIRADKKTREGVQGSVTIIKKDNFS